VADFLMPSLGADMDFGTIVEWRVRPGDHVERGDVVAVVDTEKSAIDVEIFQTGVIEAILVAEGDRVPVGTVLARIAESVPSAATPIATAPTAPPSAGPTVAPTWAVTHPSAGTVRSPLLRRLAADRHVDLSALSGTGPGGRITRYDVERGAPSSPSPEKHRRASPYARRLARELGVDLGETNGSGPRAAIVAADIHAVARTRPTAPAAVDADHHASMRRRIGDLMSRSNREIPQYHLSSTIDLDRAIRWMRAGNESRPVTERILPAALLIHATAKALHEVPGFNGFFLDGGFQPSEHVHLGVAISLRSGGLIAPAIHDAELLDVDAAMAALRDLTGRARNGRLRGSEMSDPTVTVTDLGEHSAECVHGIIYPPQVALVGFGQIADRPVAIDGTLAIHPVVTVSLAADHRVTDGRAGARLLQSIDRHLQRLETPP
jgi:pyruvate dehydrogenase E2 component (dihydrolipoamide acetyltransferase)